VRLDHLLSKEHLHPKGCQEPTSSAATRDVVHVVVVGCSMAETLVKVMAGNGHQILSTAAAG
jgi:3-polyprenyl-4-hydroxybenzoate decarboxylase